MLKHHGIVCPAVNESMAYTTSGPSVEGSRHLAGFTASRECCRKDRIMVACLTTADQSSQPPLAKRVKPSAVVVPLWDKMV